MSANIWNGWTRNFIGGMEQGYITHAFDEDECRRIKDFRSLCGVKLEETGFVKLGEPGCGPKGRGWVPACRKCLRILRNRKLIP